MKSLGIAIDGGRFVRIDSGLADSPKNVRLRTLDGRQNAARLDFYAFRSGKRILRKSVKLDGLSSHDGIPAELRLRAERLSSAAWEVRVRKPNGTFETIRVRTGFGGTALIVIPIILILIAAATFFFIPRIGTDFRMFGIGRNGKSVETGADGTVDSADTTGAEDPEVGADAHDDPDEVGFDEEGTDSASSDGNGGNTDDILGSGNGAEQTPDEGGLTEAASANEASGLSDNSGEQTAGEDRRPELPAAEVVYFAPESASLSRSSLSALDSFLGGLPDGAVVEIGGHCANFGTERGRTVLSEARAGAVAAYIRKQADPSVVIESRGYGVSRPATNDPGRQDLNRRAEIRARWDS